MAKKIGPFKYTVKCFIDNNGSIKRYTDVKATLEAKRELSSNPSRTFSLTAGEVLVSPSIEQQEQDRGRCRVMVDTL